MRFEHEAIRRTMDRDVAEALFAALVDTATSDAELDEVVASLGYVDDPRLSARLRGVVFDPDAPDRVRLAAYAVIEFGSDYFTDDERRSIWGSGNARLAERVLGSMRDEDVVLPIAADPTHALHARAIDALAFNFEPHQGLAIAALSHADPAVRRAAATTLLWEEPLDAVTGLLACLDDVDPGVRAEAENALQYFPDRRVLRRLAVTQGESFASLREEFGSTLSSNPTLRDWMDEVADLVEPLLDDLDQRPGDDEVPAPSTTRPASEPVDIAELITSLVDPGGRWSDRRERFRVSLDWTSVAGGRRHEFVELLKAHPDPQVRSVAAHAIAAWGHLDALLEMIDDPNHSVSKSAIYALVKTTPEPRVAARLLAVLRSTDRSISSFGELLGSYLHHAEPVDAQQFLVDRISASRLESELVDCVHALIELGAHDVIDGLAHLLHRPARVTWRLDITLLEAFSMRSTAIDRLPRLEDVDDLRMAEALVRHRQVCESKRPST